MAKKSKELSEEELKVLLKQKEDENAFKFFKGIATSINKFSDKFLLSGENGIIKIYFSRNSYYFLSGFLFEETIFSKWLQGKSVILSIEDLKRLSKILKKNMNGTESDEKKFVFNFIEDDKEQAIELAIREFPINMNEDKFYKERQSEIEKILTKEIVLPISEVIKEEVFEVFIEEDGERIKIVDIPVARIPAIVKGAESVKIRYSEKGEDECRYLSIESENNILQLQEIVVVI